MKLELNTDLCPIVVPDTYGTEFCNMVEDNMWEDFKKLMVDKAEEAITYALDDLGIPYRELKMGKFGSPRFYNYGTDWIDFELEIDDAYIDTIKGNVRRDEYGFFRFARSFFGSYDGFISFYPYEKDDFYDSDKAEYIFSMWVMYRQYRENDIKAFQNEYLNDVEEYAGENGYFIDEEDEDGEMY